MFKKGDVVEWVCDEYGNPAKEGARFSVLVTGLAKRFDEFSGVIVSAQEKADHREGTYLDCWDVKQFKLKQHDTLSNTIPDNAFPVLKEGMIVATRERGSYLVCGDKLLQPNGYNRVSEYLADGKSDYLPVYDIVKVWSGVSLWSLDFDYYTKNRSDEIIWQEQKNAKAIAEIEEQVADLQEQINTLQEKLVTLREEK